ncbi:putative leucine-rich repeat-containing protein DDB_G0290503 [Antennarius striatus]|uniref:putative leucine-rich repeat-containing protein DDB_G0290503 n=1 Tax=Antennarius striatus TaxID=241820 RepID=UPI0035B480D2
MYVLLLLCSCLFAQLVGAHIGHHHASQESGMDTKLKCLAEFLPRDGIKNFFQNCVVNKENLFQTDLEQEKDNKLQCLSQILKLKENYIQQCGNNILTRQELKDLLISIVHKDTKLKCLAEVLPKDGIKNFFQNCVVNKENLFQTDLEQEKDNKLQCLSQILKLKENYIQQCGNNILTRQELKDLLLSTVEKDTKLKCLAEFLPRDGIKNFFQNCVVNKENLFQTDLEQEKDNKLQCLSQILKLKENYIQQCGNNILTRQELKDLLISIVHKDTKLKCLAEVLPKDGIKNFFQNCVVNKENLFQTDLEQEKDNKLQCLSQILKLKENYIQQCGNNILTRQELKDLLLSTVEKDTKLKCLAEFLPRDGIKNFFQNCVVNKENLFQTDLEQEKDNKLQCLSQILKLKENYIQQCGNNILTRQELKDLLISIVHKDTKLKCLAEVLPKDGIKNFFQNCVVNKENLFQTDLEQEKDNKLQCLSQVLKLKEKYIQQCGNNILTRQELKDLLLSTVEKIHKIKPKREISKDDAQEKKKYNGLRAEAAKTHVAAARRTTG